MSANEMLPTGSLATSNRLATMSTGAQRQLRRDLEHVQSQVLVAEVREQGRAFIANTALQNVGALSALEAHLVQIAPLGESRYKHIVDAYTMGAGLALQRGV